MKLQILSALLIAFVLSLDGDGDRNRSRKHYGLSFHVNCRDYIRTFTCMSACKSIGFQVFRMDYACRCSCHELKTTTLLPFFKWRTNGTTRTWVKTQSVSLYHIAGTLSPATYADYGQKANNTSIIGEATEDGSDSNGTTIADGSDPAEAKSEATTIVTPATT